MSGSRVVLAMLGGTLAVALIAVAAFLLTREDNVLCVEGELQDNAVDAEGRFLPRTETFATIEEAESFVCRRIPHPRDTMGASLTEVTVTRATNLGTLIEGDGSAQVDQTYVSPNGSPGFGLSVVFPPHSWPQVPAGGEGLEVAGEDGRLVQSGGTSLIFWEDGDFFFTASSEADIESFLPILDSVR